MDAGYELVKSTLESRKEGLKQLYKEMDKDKTALEKLTASYKEKCSKVDQLQAEVRAFEQTLYLLEEAHLRRRY